MINELGTPGPASSVSRDRAKTLADHLTHEHDPNKHVKFTARDGSAPLTTPLSLDGRPVLILEHSETLNGVGHEIVIAEIEERYRVKCTPVGTFDEEHTVYTVERAK